MSQGKVGVSVGIVALLVAVTVIGGVRKLNQHLAEGNLRSSEIDNGLTRYQYPGFEVNIPSTYIPIDLSARDPFTKIRARLGQKAEAHYRDIYSDHKQEDPLCAAFVQEVGDQEIVSRFIELESGMTGKDTEESIVQNRREFLADGVSSLTELPREKHGDTQYRVLFAVDEPNDIEIKYYISVNRRKVNCVVLASSRSDKEFFERMDSVLDSIKWKAD